MHSIFQQWTRPVVGAPSQYGGGCTRPPPPARARTNEFRHPRVCTSPARWGPGSAASSLKLDHIGTIWSLKDLLRTNTRVYAPAIRCIMAPSGRFSWSGRRPMTPGAALDGWWAPRAQFRSRPKFDLAGLFVHCGPTYVYGQIRHRRSRRHRRRCTRPLVSGRFRGRGFGNARVKRIKRPLRSGGSGGARCTMPATPPVLACATSPASAQSMV